MRCLLLIALFWTIPANAADLSFSVALGKKVLEHEPFERAASVGVIQPLSETWFVKPSLGGWIGGSGKPSWFVAAPVGLRVWIPSTGYYATAAVGPSYISAPDELLGGHWQFCPEFGAGLKTEKAEIGLTWLHFSSAGLVMPNQGRDFLGIRIGVSL